MGWFDTVLDAAFVSLEFAQLGKLEKLRQQNASGAALQAVLQDLKNQIFNYKQAAITVLEYEAKDQKKTAGAMRLLEMRLQDSKILPELFPDLNDKEYVAATHRFIRENSYRLKDLLSAEDFNDVIEMTKAAQRLNDLQYYLAHKADYRRFIQQQRKPEWLKILTHPTVSTILLAVGFLAALGSIIVGEIIQGFIILVPVVAVGILALQAAQARKEAARLSATVDLRLMDLMEKEFEGDPGRVEAMRQALSGKVEHFFGDTLILKN